MADSEMRALGISAKFGNVFAKQGGTLDMLSWIADQPELMKKVVQIADRRLFEPEKSSAIKWSGDSHYNPAECLRVGTVNGVTIAEIEGNIALIALNEQRELPDLFLESFLLRRNTTRSAAYIELDRLNRNLQVSIDYLWAALLTHQNGEKILGTDGSINEFHLPYNARDCQIYLPVQVMFLERRGWKIRLTNGMSPFDHFVKGGRFILSGKPERPLDVI